MLWKSCNNLKHWDKRQWLIACAWTPILTPGISLSSYYYCCSSDTERGYSVSLYVMVLVHGMVLFCFIVWLKTTKKLGPWGSPKPLDLIDIVEQEMVGCFGGVDPPYLGSAWLLTTTSLFRLTCPTGFMSTLHPYLPLPISKDQEMHL